MLQVHGRLGAAMFLTGLALVLRVGAAEGRLIVSASDPALAGATTVPLDASIGLGPGQQFHQTTQNGVSVTFQTQSAFGYFGGIAGSVLTSFFPEGVTIDFSPPVGAVAVDFLGGECGGAAVFHGTGTDESFMFPFGVGGLPIGAADIGPIDSIELNDQCFAAGWANLYFDPNTSPPPMDEADLAMSKSALGTYRHGQTTSFDLRASNAGPDTGTGVQVVDFLPALSTLASSSVPASVDPGVHPVATMMVPDLVNGAATTAQVEIQPPPFGQGTYCGAALVNVGLVTATSLDMVNGNNVSTSIARFDGSSRFGEPEICDNAIDDDCDFRPDCADAECAAHARCRPTVIPSDQNTCWGSFQVLPDGTVVDTCGNVFARPAPSPSPGAPPSPPVSAPAGNVQCSFPTRCSGVDLQMPPECCAEPPTDIVEWFDVVSSCVQIAFGQAGSLPPECIVGNEQTSPLSWMGMPIDPNYKEADPPTNIFGHGLTSAGRTMTYRVHYENIGTADAHDVLVIDPLSTELDDSTLVINDGGVYDATSRVITWTDPVLPPNTPRSVSFSVDVRADAPLGTRVRNQATIVFPDAVPPSRIDTNPVQHRIPLPGNEPVPDISVIGCTPLGGDEWQVNLVNMGSGFAFGVEVEVIGGPTPVTVLDGLARFAHPDDTDPAQRATVMPATHTGSIDPIRLTTPAIGDPCATLTWRIRWMDTAGNTMTRDQPAADDTDDDGVPDATDVCPSDFDPGQADGDQDGVGDACDGCPADPAHTGPCPTPSPSPTPTPSASPSPSPSPGVGEVCGNCLDDDGDGKVDVADEECSARPLRLVRGVLWDGRRADRDRVLVRGTLDPIAEFDPARTGASVALFRGEELVACFAAPADAPWRTNSRGTRWVLRDRRDDSIGDPDANERIRFRTRRGHVFFHARIRELEQFTAPPAGDYTVSLSMGDDTWATTTPWRKRPAGPRLVSP